MQLFSFYSFLEIWRRQGSGNEETSTCPEGHLHRCPCMYHLCVYIELGVDLLRFIAESPRTTLKQCMNCTCELPREKPPYQRKKEMSFIPP